MATKKLKSVARFGSRYGSGVKSRVLDIEKKQKKPYNCPSCGFAKVKRKARGIFECRKCGAVFAGGAFIPETLTGGIIRKMVMQKSFMPSMASLLEATEKVKHKGIVEEEAEKSEKHEKPKKDRKHKKSEHAENPEEELKE